MKVYIFVHLQIFLGLTAAVAEGEGEEAAGLDPISADHHCLLIGAVPYLVVVGVVEIWSFWECMIVVCKAAATLTKNLVVVVVEEEKAAEIA